MTQPRFLADHDAKHVDQLGHRSLRASLERQPELPELIQRPLHELGDGGARPADHDQHAQLAHGTGPLALRRGGVPCQLAARYPSRVPLLNPYVFPRVTRRPG